MKTKPWQGHVAANTGNRIPANYITWNDATAFCRRLTEQERQAGRITKSLEYRLPTEAEWERACRAGTTTRYCFGDDASLLGDYAWYYENTHKKNTTLSQPVGLKKPNRWGIHDMHGNICEWCRDHYVDKPPGGTDPEVKAVPSALTPRVSRGGAPVFDAKMCESGYRQAASPGYNDGDFGGRGGGANGFRVALCTVR